MLFYKDIEYVYRGAGNHNNGIRKTIVWLEDELSVYKVYQKGVRTFYSETWGKLQPYQLKNTLEKGKFLKRKRRLEELTFANSLYNNSEWIRNEIRELKEEIKKEEAIKEVAERLEVKKGAYVEIKTIFNNKPIIKGVIEKKTFSYIKLREMDEKIQLEVVKEIVVKNTK